MDGISGEYSYSIKHDENGVAHIECDNEESAEFMEMAFIDWCHRGYFEPKALTKDGGIRWILTPWGKEHVNDIIKVRNEE